MDNDGVPDDEDVDDDNDGLIELTTIDDLNEIRKTLTEISRQELPGISTTSSTGFELLNDLNFDDPSNYSNPSLQEQFTQNQGWEPLGTLINRNFNDEATQFDGIFEGNGFTIDNLFIENLTDNKPYGLFGAVTKSSIIRNLSLNNVSINTASREIGGLTGYGRGVISNCSVEGQITGKSELGLLVGAFLGIRITDCSTFGRINSTNTLNTGIGSGGLIGFAGFIDQGPSTEIRIAGCYSEVNVNGDSSVGGLIGSVICNSPDLASIHIMNSYANADVVGTQALTGGLIGLAINTTITSCFSKGSVTNTKEEGEATAGGLIGSSNGSFISSSYSSVNVTNNFFGNCLGGLVGFTTNTAIQHSFCYNFVLGNTDDIGGFIGICSGQPQLDNTISNTNFWDAEISGISVTLGNAIGLTTAELQASTSNTGIYAEWDPAVWDFGTNSQYPVLKDMPNGVEAQRSEN